jgi:hypothetical protein
MIECGALSSRLTVADVGVVSAPPPGVRQHDQGRVALSRDEGSEAETEHRRARPGDDDRRGQVVDARRQHEVLAGR